MISRDDIMAAVIRAEETARLLGSAFIIVTPTEIKVLRNADVTLTLSRHCVNCNEDGHTWRECPDRPRELFSMFTRPAVCEHVNARKVRRFNLHQLWHCDNCHLNFTTAINARA